MFPFFIWLPCLLPSPTKANTNDYAAMSVSRYKLKSACKLENDELPAGLFFPEKNKYLTYNFFDIALNIFVLCGSIKFEDNVSCLGKTGFSGIYFERQLEISMGRTVL